MIAADCDAWLSRSRLNADVGPGAGLPMDGVSAAAPALLGVPNDPKPERAGVDVGAGAGDLVGAVGAGATLDLLLLKDPNDALGRDVDDGLESDDGLECDDELEPPFIR